MSKHCEIGVCNDCPNQCEAYLQYEGKSSFKDGKIKQLEEEIENLKGQITQTIIPPVYTGKE